MWLKVINTIIVGILSMFYEHNGKNTMKSHKYYTCLRKVVFKKIVRLILLVNIKNMNPLLRMSSYSKIEINLD